MLRNIILTVLLTAAINPLFSQTLFQVQLAAYAEPLPNFLTTFKQQGIENVEEVADQNGLYRYVINGFKTRLEAEANLKQVKLRDFPRATIVDLEEQRALCGTPCPFFNGGRVFNTDAEEGLTVKTIRFDQGRYSLNAEATVELDKMAFLLEHNRNYNLKILGHTDAEGDAATNMRVAADRARAARNYLIAKGISADRLYIKVYGETRPIVPNKDANGNLIPENLRLNRRVVLAIIKKEDGEVAKDAEVQPTLPSDPAEGTATQKKK